MGKKDKKSLQGTALKPRLVVFRSHKHIYVQIIDDFSSQTILSCSTIEKEIQSQLHSTSTINASLVIGKIIGERLLSRNINKIIFDRNGKPFHGRVKAIATGARESGILF